MERRVYDRVYKNLPCNLYFSMSERAFTETSAEITNISENGIALIIDYTEENAKDLVKEVIITIELVDTYEYMGIEKVDVLVEKCEIIWVKQENNRLKVGCKIISPTNNWKEYIKKQKVNRFIARGFKETNSHIFSRVGGTL